MKRLWKNRQEKIEKSRNRILYMESTLLGIILCLSVITIAWFAYQVMVEAKLFSGNISDNPFELAAVGDTKGVHKDILEEINPNEGEAFSVEDEVGKQTSKEENSIVWVLSPDSNINNDKKEEGKEQGLQPGTMGKLSYYIIPKQDGAQTIRFSLNILSYEWEAENKEELMKYFVSHVFFFEEKKDTTNMYAKWLEPEVEGERGKITFEVSVPSETKKDEPVRKDLYWVWPSVLPEIILKQKDPFLGGRKQLIATEDQDEILEYVKENEGYFFKNVIDSDTEFSYVYQLHSISNGLESGDVDYSKFNDLNRFYNQIDQEIGQNIPYILIKLIGDSVS